MTRKINETWPAVAALLILFSCSTRSSTSSSFFITSTNAFVPFAKVHYHTSTRNNGCVSSRSASLLPVAATPVSPTNTAQPANSTSGDGDSDDPSNNNDSSSNGDDMFGQYKDLQAANMALDALAMKCSNPSKEPVISRADECQSQWEAMHKTSKFTPDVVSLNTVLKAWARCCHALADYKKHQDSNPPMVTTGMEGLQLASADHPQVYTSKDAAERATLLLLHQEQEYESGHIDESARPDARSYNEVIGAWARSGASEAPHNAERIFKRMMDHDTLEPDGISYNGVVEAWAYSGKHESLQKVKQIWQKMEKLYNDGQNSSDTKNPIKPTIRTVNSIIQAHAKRVQELVEDRDSDGARKVAREAEEFLEMMKEQYEQTGDPDLMPDVMTYTTVMDTFGKIGRYHSTQRAKTLLKELKTMYEESGRENLKLKPNVRTYTSLIKAWSKTRSPDSPREVEQLLKEMEDSGDPDLLPNARTYTAVIHAWGRSADHTKAQRALKILQTMKELAKAPGRKDVAPSLISYNACLDACARCQGNLDQQTAALKIAFAVLKAIQLDPTTEANSSTYSTLLRAISFLMDVGEQRNQVARTVFQKAVKSGMVDFRVLLQLKKCVDSTTLREQLDGVEQDRSGNFDFNAIPPGWNRNVR